MLRLCRGAAEAGIPIYLYGGNPAVAERLRAKPARSRAPGWKSPATRPRRSARSRRRRTRPSSSGSTPAAPGWCSSASGCPKQDLFAYDHRDTIRAVQVCVGAAFDFHAGVKPMAPAWMQRRGLEWLYRLIQEPGRLWRRYLVTNSIFLAKLAGVCRAPSAEPSPDFSRGNNSRRQSRISLAWPPFAM